MVIQHNMPAVNANNQLKTNLTGAQKSTEKLASGYRINRAGDDAAGLAMSEKMRGQIRGLTQASANAQDGISLIQTAEGGAQEIHSILQRMRELAVKSANGTYEEDDTSLKASAVKTAGSSDGAITNSNTSVDRYAIQDEINALAAEIDRIAQATKFNNRELLTGKIESTTAALKFQVGANGRSFETINLNISCLGTAGLFNPSGTAPTAITSNSTTVNYSSVIASKTAASTGAKMSKAYTVRVNTQSAAQIVLSSLDYAINKVSINRGKLGAAQNRLEYTINNLTTQTENLTASESRVRDTDMAKETLNYTKFNILQQASQAMLAQANQQPQSVLQLLG